MKKRKKKRAGPIRLLLLIFIMVACSSMALQFKTYKSWQVEEKKIMSEINVEKAKSEDLKRALQQTASDEAIEKMAREKLGFIKYNEILIQERN